MVIQMKNPNAGVALLGLVLCVASCDDRTGRAPATPVSDSETREPTPEKTSVNPGEPMARTRGASPENPARNLEEPNAGKAAYGTITGLAKLLPGDAIGICWREANANIFARNDADYECSQQAAAVPSPWDEAEGALRGKAIVEALQRGLGARKMSKKAIAKSLKPNADPKAPASGITIGGDASGFFGNYVITDSASKHWIFLDVELIPK
jgi:hypothetical protein